MLALKRKNLKLKTIKSITFTFSKNLIDSSVRTIGDTLLVYALLKLKTLNVQTME